MVNSNGFNLGIKKFGGNNKPANPFQIQPLVKNPYVDGPDLNPDVFKPTQPVIIEPSPYQTPVEIPDWSKMPMELPPGVPPQEFDLPPSGPTVPDWSKFPKELPNPRNVPMEVPYEFPGKGHQLPGELPNGVPNLPGQVYFFS